MDDELPYDIANVTLKLEIEFWGMARSLSLSIHLFIRDSCSPSTFDGWIDPSINQLGFLEYKVDLCARVPVAIFGKAVPCHTLGSNSCLSQVVQATSHHTTPHP
jgi:hypothetical protein